MKTTYVVAIVMALFLVSACGPTVNAPADIEAIKNLEAGYEEAYNSGDLDWFSSTYWANDAIRLPPNQMMLSGSEAIMAGVQATLDQYSPTQISVPVEEVTSSGDMAVARGTYYWTGTPVASGLSPCYRGAWAIYHHVCHSMLLEDFPCLFHQLSTILIQPASVSEFHSIWIAIARNRPQKQGEGVE